MSQKTGARLPLSLRILRRFPLPHKLGLLDRMYGQALRQIGKGWVECSNGIVWRLDLSDNCNGHRWIVYGDYEGENGLNWVRHWLRGGGVVVDSGANIGQMLLYLAPLRGVTVVAIEPLDEAYAWLCKCLQIQNGWNVKLEKVGLSDHTGSALLQVGGPRSTLRLDWYVGKNLQQESIQLRRLDDVLDDLGFDSVRLWKLDVEGHELEALRGAKKRLAAKKVEAIYIEVTGGNLDAVKDCLDEVSYQLYTLNNSSKLSRLESSLAHTTTNLIALPV